MKKCNIAACIIMILAVLMIVLPFYHVSLPAYFESDDISFSGAQLVKTGLGMTESKMEENVEDLRSLIKDCDELEDAYKALGRVSKLVAKARIYAIVSVCVPCLLLLAGVIAGFLSRTKKAYILPAALNAAAMLIHGAAGIWTMAVFGWWKDKLTDGLEQMESISTGISFLDTVLDTASDIVAENIDKIKLQLQAGWVLFLVLALAALACWAVILLRKQDTVQQKPDAAGAVSHFPDVGSDVINSGPMGVDWQKLTGAKRMQDSRGMDVEDMDPQTNKMNAVIPDVNSYIGLPRINPQRPAGILRGLEGTYQGAEIPLGNKKAVLGRNAASADLVFPASANKVSRAHCEIIYDPGRGKFHIRDISTNGVFIYICESGRYTPQPKRLKKDIGYTLAAGTILDIGSKENRFRLE